MQQPLCPFAVLFISRPAAAASCHMPEFICYNIDMDKEKLMALLRNPKKFRQNAEQQTAEVPAEAPQKEQTNRSLLIAGIVVVALLLLTVWFVSNARNRADNIAAFLDPAVLQGLAVDAEFNPNSGTRYIQIREGQDRNVTVQELGSTLPVISRYNYRALTPNNYKIIGEAPYALTINVSSNIDDPDLLRYLFNNDNTAKAFIARADVAPLLEDPALLAQAAADPNRVNAFLADETVQKVLASSDLVDALAGSRLFSYMLISKAVKYYRDRPAEAAKLINSNPALAALKQNPNVRKAVAENSYLKNISATLLK